MNKYNTIIVDCYNLIYRSIEDETVVSYKNEKFHTEGIIGFLKAMDAYIKKYGTEDVKIYWLFDNAKTSIQKYRKSLSEDYKKTRVEMPEWFYKQLDMLELLLKNYRDNSYLFRVKFLEADDYVNKIIESYLTKEDRVLLISEDSDWVRALNDNVHQYAKGKIYDKSVFLEEYKFEPTNSNICFYKTIYGDKTDNIKSAIGELPKVYFYDIINKYSTIYDFIVGVKNNSLSYLDSGWKARISKEEELLILNWNLVSAVEISTSELDSFQYKCKFQKDKLYMLYSALHLLGKVDQKRFPVEVTSNDFLDELFSGIEVSRKKQ